MAIRRPVFQRWLNAITTPSRHVVHGHHPYDLLPEELWEVIFQRASDSELLRISTVCRAFNALCIRIIFIRNGFSPENGFSSPAAVISGPVLAALYLSFRSFSFRRLTCATLGTSNLLWNLKLVGAVVHRSKNLGNLGLTFHRNVFTLLSGLSARTQRVLMSAFCSILSDMASRINGPVVILAQGRLFSCRANEIGDWDLDLFHFTAAIGERARRALNIRGKDTLYRSTKIRLHTGEMREVYALRRLESVAVETMTDLVHFTILTFNAASFTHLTLSRQLQTPDWSTFIAKVALPCLRSLTLDTDTLDPGALRLFLVVHPTIHDLKYVGSAKELKPRPFITPALAHPGLRTLDTAAYGVQSMGRMLQCLDTSPLLHKITFSFPASLSSANLEGFLLDLRSVATRTSDMTLELYIWAATSGALENAFIDWTSTVEARDVAISLQCIRFVRTFSAVDVALNSLHWLSFLPAVVDIQFDLWEESPTWDSAQAVEDEVAGFLAKARASLPHVPAVEASLHRAYQ